MAGNTMSMCFFILFDSSLCTEFVKLRLVKEYWVKPGVDSGLLIYRSLVWILFICKGGTVSF